MNRIKRCQGLLKQFNSIYALRSTSIESSSTFERKFCTKKDNYEEPKDAQNLSADVVDKDATLIEFANTNTSNPINSSTPQFQVNDNNEDQVETDIQNVKASEHELKKNKTNIQKYSGQQSNDTEESSELYNTNSIGSHTTFEYNTSKNIPEYVPLNLLNALPADGLEKNRPTFATLFRNSKFVLLGNPQGKTVIGQVFNVVGNDLYIDFGWKFHCVCPKPKKKSRLYTKGSVVYIMINDLELSTRFLGATTDITLLEADCTLLGLKSSPLQSKEPLQTSEAKVDHETV